jgi:soluble lytic murein transglycosylase
MQMVLLKNAPRGAWTRWFAVVALSTIAAVATAQAPAPAPTLQQQRDAFRTAYAAAQAGQDWRPLAKGLQDYPLYPYLEAAALQHDIKTATPAAIDAYLARYPDLIPAGDLRTAELSWAAQQKDWATFRHFYQPGLGDTFTCDALQANLADGKRLDFDRDLTQLWQQTQLPSA